MRRPALQLGETLIYLSAAGAAAVLVLYPIWGLIREAVAGAAGPGAFLEALAEPRVVEAAFNSLQLSIGTAVLATLTGASLAVIVTRTNTPFARYMGLIGPLPLLTMPFVGAIAWTLLAAPRTGFLNLVLRAALGSDAETGPIDIYNMAGMIWVMGLFYSPYVFILTSSALRAVDSSLEEAARLGGAPPRQVLRYITIPVVTPAIVAGAFLTFTLSAGQFAIPAVIGLPARVEVLPVVIYAKAQTYPVNLAELTGIGLLLLGVTGAALVVQRHALGRRVYETVTGKGSRGRPIDLGPWRFVAFAVVIGYLLAAIVLPLIALLYSSFLKYSTTSIRFDLLTLDNYREVFSNPMTWRSFQNSAILSVTAATIAMLLGLIISYVIHRTRIRGRLFMQLVSVLPLGVPSIVLAVGVLAAWIRPPVVLYGSLVILIVAYAGHFLPTATQAAGSGLIQISRELEDAARISGAKWVASMRHILGPLILPALIGGWFLLVIGMFREMSSSVLLYSPGQEVVSIALFNLWTGGAYNPVAAFAVTVTAISFALFALLQTLGGRRRVITQ